MAGELVLGILYNLFLPLLLLAGESAYSFNSYGCDVFVYWSCCLLNLPESAECVVGSGLNIGTDHGTFIPYDEMCLIFICNES